MYSNNILNFQESMTILDACTKEIWNLIECIYIYIDIYIYIGLMSRVFANGSGDQSSIPSCHIHDLKNGT